jgi:hypothetical protein
MLGFLVCVIIRLVCLHWRINQCKDIALFSWITLTAEAWKQNWWWFRGYWSLNIQVWTCMHCNICLRINICAVGIATGYGLDDQGVGVQVLVGSRIFSTSSRPDLGSTQPPIQWVLGAFPQGWSGRIVKLTTHLQLVLRSRKCGFIQSPS